MPPCKYVEVCDRAADTRIGDDLFCILHLPPGPAKNLTTFRDALANHMAAGHCDFRWIYFPEVNPSFEGRHFRGDVDFRNSAMIGSAVSLQRVRIDGNLSFGDAPVPNVNLNESSLGGGLRIDTDILDNTLDLYNARIEGPVEIRVRQRILHVRAVGARFSGGIRIETIDLRSLELVDTQIATHLVLRVRGQTQNWKFDGARLPRLVDLRSSIIDGDLPFARVVFEEDSKLDLTNTLLRGNLVLVGRSVLPREIIVRGAEVTGRVEIKAELGSSTPHLVAPDVPPRFGGTAELVNVDLTQCLLVGNPIHKMDLSRVVWPERYGRRILLDEQWLRSARRRIPLNVSSVQEAYQILKKQSGDRGDHALAGDFHYGELEMRRHGRSGFGSLFCWEFLYWIVSGYGTRPAPAFAWICALTLLGALLYWSLVPMKTFSEALRFSVAVTTLQKREDPSDIGAWIRVIQTILGAVLIALFVLAVRMRLKR